MTILKKKCLACGKRLSLPSFERNYWSPDGRNRRCSVCKRTGREIRLSEDPDEIAKTARLENKAYDYAQRVLYPEYKNWHLSLTRARAAYGL